VVPTPRPSCPIPDRGGTCLGELHRGTYSTVSFSPTITYSVPADGWANWEDLSALFLLLPPGEALDGVDADTSDFIGVYRNLRVAAASCAEEPQAGVGASSQAMAAWFRSDPGLTLTNDRAISVGGRRGRELDLELKKGWTGTCPYSVNGRPLVPLIVGTGDAAGLHHVLTATFRTRLYLLDEPGGNIVIEVVDHPEHGASFDDYSAVVRTLTFGPT